MNEWKCPHCGEWINAAYLCHTHVISASEYGHRSLAATYWRQIDDETRPKVLK